MIVEEISATVQWILGLLGVISASEAGVIIRQMWAAAKTRREAKSVSEDGHKTTHDKLDILIGQKDSIIAANDAEIAKLQRKVARLEKEKAALKKSAEGVGGEA